MNLMQRFRDWRHERHISRLSLQCRAAMSAGHKDMARLLWNAQAAAIKARSPAQVARMERQAFARMDPHDQRTFLKHGGSAGTR